MKNNYEKIMKEVWDTKTRVYKDYLKSRKKSYIEFIKTEVSKIKKSNKLNLKSRTIKNLQNQNKRI